MEVLPLGWRFCHWGGGFATGVEVLLLGWRFAVGGQCRVAMGDGEGGYTDVISQILER